MNRKTRRIIYMLLALMYITPSHGVTFISGIEPVRSNSDNYWWIENKSDCQINIEAWVSFDDHQDKVLECNVSLSETKLRINNRAIVTISKEGFKKNKKTWLNILEESYCDKKSKLIRVSLL